MRVVLLRQTDARSAVGQSYRATGVKVFNAVLWCDPELGCADVEVVGSYRAPDAVLLAWCGAGMAEVFALDARLLFGFVTLGPVTQPPKCSNEIGRASCRERVLRLV